MANRTAEIYQPNPQVFLQSSQQTDPSTSPNDVDVDIRVRELSRFKLQTGTDVGNGEGSAYGCSAALRCCP